MGQVSVSWKGDPAKDKATKLVEDLEAIAGVTVEEARLHSGGDLTETVDLQDGRVEHGESPELAKGENHLSISTSTEFGADNKAGVEATKKAISLAKAFASSVSATSGAYYGDHLPEGKEIPLT